MNETPSELTRAIASGDTEAFGRLYEAHFDDMLLHAMRCTGRDHEYCLDIVQDSMMKVIRCIKPIHSEAALRAWLRCVVKSCAYDSLRRDARRRRYERCRNEAAPDQADDLNERLHWLRSQLLALDDDTKHLVFLRHRVGWTLQRIAGSLGLSPGAVDGRLTRTLRKLQSKAEQLDD